MARKSFVHNSEKSKALTTPVTPFKKKISNKNYNLIFTPFTLSKQKPRRSRLTSVEINQPCELENAYEILPNLDTKFLTRENYFREYNIVLKCGEGSFMTAYKVYKDNNTTCLKISNRPYRGKMDRASRLKEVDLLYRLRNSLFVTKIIQAWEQNLLLYIELEYYEYTLSKMLKNKVNFDDILVCKLSYEISSGLLLLHKLGYVHNDVKPENIFYVENFKIGDFNISQKEGFIDQDGDKKYMAPEILDGQCNMKSDVYSLGLVIAEIICGIVLPTTSKDWLDLRKNRFRILSFPRRHRKFLFKMLHMNYNFRPSMEDVSNYFQKFLSTAPAAKT